MTWISSTALQIAIIVMNTEQHSILLVVLELDDMFAQSNALAQCYLFWRPQHNLSRRSEKKYAG